jgi:hypothetical protein
MVVLCFVSWHMSNALHCSIMEALSHRAEAVKKTLESLAELPNGGAELGR